MNTFPNESELIRLAKHGELDAFNSILLHYQDFLFRVAFRILHDEDRANDIVQETCLLAFRKLETYGDGSFRNWLARIAINACYDELRRQRRHPLVTLEPDEAEETPYWLTDNSTNPEAKLGTKELEGLIQRCLETVPATQRIVLILIDMEEYSYEEAAELLNIPIGTVKSRLARARLQLRNSLLRTADLPAKYCRSTSLACI